MPSGFADPGTICIMDYYPRATLQLFYYTKDGKKGTATKSFYLDNVSWQKKIDVEPEEVNACGQGRQTW